MLFDALNMFAKDEEITASGSEVFQISHKPAGLAGWGYKQRCQLWIVGQVNNEAFNNLTTLELLVEYSNDNSSWVIIMRTGGLALAKLTVGAILVNQAFPVAPLGVKATHLRGRWVVSGSDPSTGRLTFGIIPDGLRSDAVARTTLARRVPTSFDYFPGNAARTS